MTASATAPLVHLLRELTLLEPDQLAEVEQTLAGQFPDRRALAQELLQRGWLTSYQITQLGNKKGRELLLGPYVLLDRLGQGGMGEVFKARHRKLGRVVAIKLIVKDRLDNPAAVKRFYREVQAASQLDHPNIVRAIDADCVGDTHIFVMEYVDGVDLAKLLNKHGPLPIAVACDYIRQAALGLQHAFERGLVHRDIKPSNLLLASGGREPPVSSESTGGSRPPLAGAFVKILDMGLARVNRGADDTSGASTLTQEGMVMGTPDYIAPEQARSSHEVDIRADLYSLGCTFYHLLTGQAPFAGGSFTEKLLKHQLDDAVPVEMVRLDTPPHIARIVRQLMAKRPGERFQSPAELVNALSVDNATLSRASPPPEMELALRDEASIATPPEQPTAATLPLVQQLRRRRAEKQAEFAKLGLVAGISIVVVFVGLVLFVLRPWSGARTKEPEPTTPAPAPTKAVTKTLAMLAAEAEKKRTADANAALEGLAASLRERPTFTKFAQEVAAFNTKFGGTPAAIKAAEMLMGLPSPLDQLDPVKIPEDARAAWKASGFDGQDVVAVLGEHRGKHMSVVRRVLYHPNGKIIASSGDDGLIRLWDGQTLYELGQLKGASPTFVADGKMFALVGPDVCRWDFAGKDPGEAIPIVKALTTPRHLAVSRNGKLLAVSQGDPVTIGLWDLSGQAPRKRGEIAWPGDNLNSLTLDAEGKLLATGSHDKLVRLWDLQGNGPRELDALRGHGDWVYQAVVSPDGKRIASAGAQDWKARLWDLTKEGGKEAGALPFDTATCSVAFSGDGKLLAVGLWNGDVALFDVTPTGLVAKSRLKGHQKHVWGLSFSPDDKVLAAGGEESILRLWEVATGKEVQPLTGHAGPLNTVSLSCNDSLLLSADSAGNARIWDPITGREQASFAGMQAWWLPPVTSSAERQALVIAPNGILLKVGQSGNVLHQFGPVSCVAATPDGRLALAGLADGDLFLLDLESGKELQHWPSRDNTVRAVACLPDGHRAISGGPDGSVRIWEIETGRLLKEIRGDWKEIIKLAASPSGRLALATITTPHFARLLDLETGRTMHDWLGGTNVSALTFSPDGTQVALASSPDNTTGLVQVCNVADGGIIFQRRLPGLVYGLAFAHDGRHLVTANGNGTVFILRINTQPTEVPPPADSAKAKQQQTEAANSLGVPLTIENSIGIARTNAWQNLRSAHRNTDHQATSPHGNIGFRVVCEVPGIQQK